MSHQAHNIPWATVGEIFSFDIRKKPNNQTVDEFTEPLQRLVDRFIHAFAKTVKEFEETEKAKLVGPNANLPNYPLLFDNNDATVQDLPGVYNIQNIMAVDSPLQRFEEWKAREGTGDGERASIIKILFHRGQFARVATLVLKYNVNLESLERTTYSNFFHYGTRRILEDAILLYISVNGCLANQSLGKVSYNKEGNVVPNAFERTCRMALSSEDYNINHDRFKPFFTKASGDAHLDPGHGHLADPDPKEFSKVLFRDIYQYSLLQSLQNRPIDWDRELRAALHCLQTYVRAE